MKAIKKTEFGLKGEQIACKYLQGMGFTILERNWRHGHKEIDIIAEKDSVLHIIEVKTRASTFFERPQDAVTIAKQRLLVSATQKYVESSKFNGEVVFDIVAVLLHPRDSKIEFIPEAFYPMMYR